MCTDGQGFGSMTRWTVADVPDQHGRTVIVTGANSGLGAEAARVLARAGAKVIMASRNPDKTQALAELIGGNTAVARTCSAGSTTT